MNKIYIFCLSVYMSESNPIITWGRTRLISMSKCLHFRIKEHIRFWTLYSFCFSEKCRKNLFLGYRNQNTDKRKILHKNEFSPFSEILKYKKKIKGIQYFGLHRRRNSHTTLSDNQKDKLEIQYSERTE